MNAETNSDDDLDSASATSSPVEDVQDHPVPTVVAFEHPFFAAVEGTYFRMVEEGDTPVMVTPLETGAVDLRLDGVMRELKLKPDSADARMLDVIALAVTFVQAIRIGDPVPSELHSGKPSWEITDQHRAIAKARVTMQLVTWLSGDEEVMTDMEQLAMVAEDPAMKTKVNEAFGEAAEKLGLGRENREEVVTLVDDLCEELAAIEALRTQLERISVIESRVKELQSIYRSARGVMDTIIPVTRLCAIAMKQFRADFEDVDAQTGEIMAVLKNMDSQVAYIRERRDDLYRRFWAWSDIVEKWHMQPAARSPHTEKLLLETYQFLAQRFLPQNEWELFTKAQERANKVATESMW